MTTRPLSMVCLLATALSAQSFEFRQIPFAAPTYFFDLTAGDLNGDGWPDLAFGTGLAAR